MSALLALDPLLVNDIGLTEVLIVLGKCVIAFVVMLVSVMAMVWFERKLHADMTNRIGPSQAGPFGIFQTLADGVKLFFKEDLVPSRSDKIVFALAPFLSLVPAIVTFAVVPVAGNFADGGDGSVHIFGRDTYLQVADPPVGILLFLSMSSIAVYGIMLAGWASGSKYPLLGSVRASAQMVSYEAALGLSLAAVILKSGSLSTNEIVRVQAGEGFAGIVPNWNLIVTGFVPFVIFLIAGTAELNRPPFDLVEAEQEIVGGYHTEYSSIRFALFFLAEFLNVVTMSALIVTLFLGGPSGPAFIGPAWIWSLVWFLAKTFIFLFLFVQFRATLPRLRYDQLMDLGWKLLIPLALGWFLLLAALQVADDHDWNPVAVAAGVVAVMALGGGLLMAALNAGEDKARELAEDRAEVAA
jgi:NADH-quinone oxidoreductase subunit H